MNRATKDRFVAGGVTIAVALMLLLLLFFTGIGLDKEQLAASSIPETGNDEELFIEPELDLEELPAQNLEQGSPDANKEDESPSEPFKGDPLKSDNEQPQRIEPGRNPAPAPANSPQKTQKTTSPVKTTEPTATERERQQASSKVAGAFSANNGSNKGSNAGNGATSGRGAGLSVSGSLNGRKFLGCDKFNPELENKVTVKVSVTVNAEGIVTAAKITGASQASEKVKNQCLRAAHTARWAKKAGAPDQRGTLTFNIVPK